MTPSATVFDLGKRVKAKYPGSYDDLPDDELGRKIKAKYPGSYDDFADKPVEEIPTAAQKPIEGSALGRFASGALDVARGVVGGIGSAIGAASSGNPYEAMKFGGGMVEGAIDQAGKAKEAAQRGETSEALGHGLAAAVPGVGPAAAHAAERMAGTGPKYNKYGSVIEQGNAPDVAGGLGETTALIGASSPENVLKPVARGAAAVKGKVTAPLQLRPNVAVEKIWRPSPADSDFPQVTPDALADVKTYGNSRVRTNADTKIAAEQAIQTLQGHLDQWLTNARVRGVRVNGDDIVRATADAIPETMRLEDPQGARALVGQAQQAYGGRQFTTDQFRQYLKEKNAGSASFYGKSGARQQAGVTSGTPEAIEKIQGDAIREALYRALDPENGGAGPREIQTRTGRLYDLRNAADRRANAITGEKSVSGAQTLERLFGIPGKLFHGNVEGAMASPSEGVSDPMIARLFEQTGTAPPLPRPPGIVRNLNPNRALGPGGPGPFQQGPITPDASFVRSAPGMNQPPNATRALPPASQVQVPPSPLTRPTGETVPNRTGVPGPDVSFARGVNAPINPKTSQPWTAEEIKSYLAALPKYAKGGIIKKPTLLSDLKTGKPTGIMAEAGPEEIKPLDKPDLGSDLSDLTKLTRRAVRIPSGTFPRPIPDGMAVHVDSTSGDKIVFNPRLTSIHDIKTAVAMKRLTPLLGKTHSPSAMSSTKHIMKQSRRFARRMSKPTL